jgi:branched-chain amino acid transport system substrate-binding protein
VLVFSGHTKGAITATRQMKEMGVSAPMIGITHCESADIVGKFGAAAEGIMCPTQWAETLKYKDKYFGSAMEYNKAFLAAHSEYKEVPYQTAQASAAIEIWADAFRRGQTFDTEKLRETLTKTNFETFYGKIKFDDTGKNIGKPMVLRQVQNGKYVVVAPTKYASDPLVFPRQAASP